MKVKVEKLENNFVQFEIELDEGKFNEGVKKSFIKNAKRFNIPGFRKGKAPQHIIERYYGIEVLYEDAVNILCPEAYDEAVEKENIIPVDQPEIDIVQIEKGKAFIFTAKVAVKPEVELGEYKNIATDSEKVSIKVAEVKAELDKEVEKNARMVDVEGRAVKSGDTTKIDFEGFVDDVAFEGGKGVDYDLTIGSNSFIPGFEDQIIGANIGDELDVNVSFPEDYGQPDLAGKPALFKVVVKDIKVKELPKLDDEFAQDVSEFDTLDEFKKDIKKKLEEKAKQQEDAKVKDEIVRQVVENATVVIPEPMIARKQESLMGEFEQNLQYSGIGMEQYLQMLGRDKEDIMKDFKERAEIEVKMELVLEQIAKEEKIEPTDEEVDGEIESMAKAYNQKPEDFKKMLVGNNLDFVKNSIIIRKTVDFLKDNAKITEKAATAKTETAEKKPAAKKTTTSTAKKPAVKKATTTAAKKPAAKKPAAKKETKKED